jgi:transcription antitermination factor NusG
LQIRTKREHFTAELLRDKGCDVLLPVHTVRRRWSDREKTLQQPLFPGYLFCRVDLGDGVRVVDTPGVIRFVGFGRTPAPVPDVEIEAVRIVSSSELPVRPCPFMKAGDLVEIKEGPLRGAEGVLVSEGDPHLVVSITLLRRSIAVKVDRTWVTLSSVAG